MSQFLDGILLLGDFQNFRKEHLIPMLVVLLIYFGKQTK
jgi:hypothetical protein